MYEFASTPEIRAAIEAAHRERAKVFAAMIHAIFAFRLGRKHGVQGLRNTTAV